MSNTLKLQLENFQSISSGELEFKVGLNFIIGQSNSGKSATFRAIKACLENPSGAQRFIKKGSSCTAVTLTYNGNQITWRRTPKENSYIINGETYVKTGRANAFKILENETGFIQGDGDAIMNIEEELQLPFPFGLNKSELFKLYENVFCVSDSAVILKSAKEHESKVKFDIDLLDVELNKNKTKLQELEAFKKEVEIETLKEHLSDCKKLNDRLVFLKEGADVIQLAVKASTINVDIVPLNTEDKISAYKELVYLKGLTDKVKKYHKLGKELPAPMNISSEKLVLLKDKEELKELTNRLKALNKIKLEEKQFVDKLTSFREKQELGRVLKQVKGLHEIRLKTVEFENKLAKYNELVKYKEDLKIIRDKGSAKKKELEKNRELLKHLQEKLSEYKVCPLCHRPLER